MQYNAAIAIKGVIRGSSRELGLKLHKSKRWLKKFNCFYKIKNIGTPSCLAELILSESHFYNTRNTRNITIFCSRSDAFKY